MTTAMAVYSIGLGLLVALGGLGMGLGRIATSLEKLVARQEEADARVSHIEV